MYCKKKVMAFIMSSILLLVSTLNAYAGYKTYYEDVSTKEVACGCNLKKVVMATNRGWIRYNVLKIDMNKLPIKFKVLYSSEGISHRESLKSMIAGDEKVIAAINGDFFNMANITDPIGMAVDDGKVLSTPNNTLNFATFCVNKSGNLDIKHLGNNVRIHAPNGKSQKIFAVNKGYRGYNDIAIFTKEWGAKSPGAPVEMLVKSGVVEKINYNGDTGKYGKIKEGLNIGNDEIVVTSNYYKNNFILKNFKVGDAVKIDYDLGYGISADTLKFAMGGKNILLSGGKITNEAWKDKNIEPITALGFNKKKELILFTVDGRVTQSAGMNMAEVAETLKQNGATEAISFDSGGSTTLMVKGAGESEVSLENIPSDGVIRKVIDGIGIVPTKNDGKLYGIKLSVEDDKIFKDSRRRISISGYDKGNQNVEINQKQIKWDVKGVNGKFDGNYFIPSSIGKATITASIGNINGKLKIEVLDEPMELILNKDYLDPDIYNRFNFSVYGEDREGVKALIDNSDINWELADKSFGTAENGVFEYNKDKNYRDSYSLLNIKFKNVLNYCIIGNKSFKDVVDDFSNSKAKFSAYPKEVAGSLQFTNSIAKTDKSAKLYYDFTATEKTRAAYIDFNNKSIGNAKGIAMWVYGDQSGHMLKAIMKNSNGKYVTVDLEDNINWSGWKWVESDLTKYGLSGNIKLSKIYVVETQAVKKDKSSIYVDDVYALKTEKPKVVSNIKTTKFWDYQNGKLNKLNPIQDFSIAFVNNWSKVSRINIDKLNKSSNSIMTFTRPSKTFIASYGGNIFGNGKDMKTDYKGATFLKVCTDKNGITSCASSQWKYLNEGLKYSKKKNIFVVLARSIYSKGFNSFDREYLLTKLKQYRNDTGKNVYVVQFDSSSYSNNSFVEDGLRIISISTNSLKSIPIFQITDNEVRYRFE